MPHFFEQYRKSEVTETHRIIHTPSDTAKRTFLYIQEAGYLKSLKPHLGRRSGLSSYLFLIVLSGSGSITYKGVQHEVSAQDCFLLDCREAYSHISTEQDPWELLWLHFNGEQAPLLYQYVIQKNGHCFRVNNLPAITDAVHELIALNSDVSEYSDLSSSYLITQILTLSVTGCQKHSGSQAGIKEKLYQVLTYINEHFNESITLDTLSGQFYISKYHLAREFKKEYNQTIVQYLLNKRITCAKELLRFTDMNIGEIAQRCGIKDLNYFNKVFRKIEGCTASEYRRRW
ncbi:AraC family transcriptional regulator [Lacrimispora sp. 210928-DFI.3.58]|uniref:AraC family transcriptional regulator n=1 Tax=Lacrimispora sp. 210928-DFI.3.58 TaxID=2883214 RepID=UPI001D097BC0|nr:AraC family transcriptional regulator [Lacrimispora sp. 210928-DFI.3.58]MCB7319570.1 AraC family transcriptional regulator [Lacrimispora sp. 210928-DFI.3.58]